MNPSEQELSYSREVRSNAEDVALIRRMCDADETALGALYDRWARSLYSLVFHLLKDPDEAEDVVEETFWQAWRKASSYEPSRGAVSTWLLTIGRRRALDRLRAKSRRKEESTHPGVLADIASPASDPLQMVESSERRSNVLTALSELPDEQREVLELGYFQGLSQSEIADTTGQPLGTVKTRMRLAMQKLREPLSMYREGAQ
jgi:RNA polymerase sigma-70 factor (ECF subfamily)